MTICRIRIGREGPSIGAFEWGIVDSNGAVLDSGEAPFRYPPAGACELLIASDLVLLDRVPAPAAQQRRISGALRFLVEDSVIPDPERQHVATASASPKDTMSVGIIDRQWLAQTLASLERSGLVARSAWPECLAPELPPRTWVLVWNGGGGFVRTGEVQGFALDTTEHGEIPVSLRLALEEARTALSAPDRLLVRGSAGVLAPSTDEWPALLGIRVETGPEYRWMETWRAPGLDLLQGEFAPRATERGWTRGVRRLAILAGAFALLGIAGLALDWGVKARERRSLIAETQAIFRASFGENAVVVDAPLQMDRSLTQLRRQSGQIGPDDFLALMSAASERLLDPAKVRIDSLSYGRGTLALSVRPIDPAQFSALFGELRAKAPIPGLDIKVESAEASGNVNVRLAVNHGGRP